MGERILHNVHASGYEQPTPIQMQSIPCMMEQREILASAPTGSGKTAAFLLPILHQLKEPQRKGFRALILAPTRELAQQTFRECNRLADGLGFKIHIIEKTNTAEKKFGPKSNQKFDILVTTPNRLVYLLKQNPPVISLSHVQWLVVDESDKLFEEGKTGFRDQVSAMHADTIDLFCALVISLVDQTHISMNLLICTQPSIAKQCCYGMKGVHIPS